MNMRKQLLVAAAVLLGLIPVSDALANISNAAVLFLRIAPGSRAAGMGEAYVAIADDATATHWNPAGLGSYPLSDTWIEAEIPAAYRPLKGFAPLSTGGDHNYLDYDIWAITPQGLIRYDNKRWNTDEVFSTRTDETLEQIVKNYFRIDDPARLEAMIERVAALNNRGGYDVIEALRDTIVASIPETYDTRETVLQDMDSLLVCYRRCLVNWDRVQEVRDRLKEGLKDGALNDTECDRVAVSLERTRNRFLPEELRVPYSALFSGEPTAVASNGDVLLVGSADGLASFNGRYWTLVKSQAGEKIGEITSLHTVGEAIIVGMSDGIGVFRGATVSPLTNSAATLPDGSVDAIGGSALTDLYAVVAGDVYRFNGMQWTGTTSYTVAVDDSLDKIAARFSIYGSAADKERFIEKYRDLQTATMAPAETPVVLDSAPTASIDTTVIPAVDSTMPPAEQPGDTVVAPASGIAGIDTPFHPGAEIRVPIAASVKGKVRAIFVDVNHRLWLGTDHGIFYFDGSRWQTPGYSQYTIASGETLDTIASRRSGLTIDELDMYKKVLREINDLDGEPQEGATIKVYTNPAAHSVNAIGGDGRTVYFATEDGLIEFDGRNWSRTGLRGLTRDNIVGVSLLGSESWLASNEKLVIKGRGHSEISVMHVNWLPELASDLYYEFLSVAGNKEGWGTFGGSITFISYGKFQRTNETGQELGEFESFDIAGAISYGTSLTNKLKGGVSVKVIYSRLSDQGAGAEKGSGTATGFALDLGLLYHMTPRLTWGLALTNLGPEMSYIDADQSDDLPRNLAIGVAYRLLRSEYTSLIATVEANKLMVGLDGKTSKEIKESIFNGGIEFTYANLFAARAGYIYDQEGEIKTPTIGFGLSPFTWGEFDFAYIPSQKDFSLANTLRISLRLIL
ncbi:MAG: PorV/PorQ family protein [Candidatus Zixiibacteriota bacterium]